MTYCLVQWCSQCTVRRSGTLHDGFSMHIQNYKYLPPFWLLFRCTMYVSCSRIHELHKIKFIALSFSMHIPNFPVFILKIKCNFLNIILKWASNDFGIYNSSIHKSNRTKTFVCKTKCAKNNVKFKIKSKVPKEKYICYHWQEQDVSFC